MLRIALDFDGTVVEHKYPRIGREAPYAIYWIKKWLDAGAMLILWTMRSDGPDGPMLTEAIRFLDSHNIQLQFHNEFPSQKIWTESPKVHAHVYVDDAAFGCPLKQLENGAKVVDWEIVGPQILKMIEGQ